MSVRAHPRILRRRTHVREHRARRHLRRALGVLLLVVTVGAVAWIAQSPLFSVTSLEVEGADRAGVSAVLEQHRVYVGRPLVLIRTGSVEAALAADPWVKEVTVKRHFPDRVEIRITERIEVAAVPVTGGWRTVSDDGHIMASVAARPAHLARVGAGVALAGPGEDTVSESMLGVVEFLAALPDEVVAGMAISASGGGLVAEVGDHHIRLGTPTNMAAKAAALMAVLADERLASDAVIDVIAPTRPAVSSPPLIESSTGDS